MVRDTVLAVVMMGVVGQHRKWMGKDAALGDICDILSWP